MKSISRTKSTIDEIIPSRKRINQFGEILAKMKDLHENKAGYPKSKSSFYIIYNNKCSQILYVDKKETFKNVVQLLIEYEFECYFYRFENRVLNENSLYLCGNKNGSEFNFIIDEKIETLINGHILKNDFYIIVYSKVDKNEEAQINYNELDKKLNECISKRINPLDKIKFLTSFENKIPDIDYDTRVKNMIYERLLYDIGTQTLTLKSGSKNKIEDKNCICVFKNFDKVGHDPIKFITNYPYGKNGCGNPKNWMNNFVSIRNNMEKMKNGKKCIPPDEIASFNFKHFGLSDKLFVSKKRKLKDVIQDILELKVEAYVHQCGTHFFSDEELEMSIEELINRNIIEKNFYILTSYDSKEEVIKICPNAVYDDSTLFHGNLRNDELFRDGYQNYVTSTETQCDFLKYVNN